MAAGHRSDLVAIGTTGPAKLVVAAGYNAGHGRADRLVPPVTLPRPLRRPGRNPPVDGPHDYFQLVLKDNELDWRLFTQSAPIPPNASFPPLGDPDVGCRAQVRRVPAWTRCCRRTLPCP